MTPDQARQILDDVRDGCSGEPQNRIRLALQMTGDMPGWREFSVPQESALRTTNPRAPAHLPGAEA